MNTSTLPINLDKLIHRKVIENDRVEFKATWDEYIKKSVVRSVCAFANDLLNNNGGYIILGIEEREGKPVLPPCGLDDLNIDQVQREIVGACKGDISPEFLPHIYVEQYQEKTILVIWVSAGDNRPYEASTRKGKGKVYWIRSAGTTVEAAGDLRRQLLEQSAKIPFDDRRSLTAKMKDISSILVNQFLEDIKSHLASMQLEPKELYEKLKLVVPVNDHQIPRNAALLFFNEDPERFFGFARLEVVQFRDDAGGDLIEEKEFRGPIPEQIHSCLNYIKGISGMMIEKVKGQAKAEHIIPYPYGAIEEVIVNAVYHRSYEYPPEPIKVYMYPDRMEITSYPGPVPGIRLEHFKTGRLPAVPARNRRIGEFLKDLGFAEARGTGIAKIGRAMKENGSPGAIFDFDDDRTYFRVILPIHPRYLFTHSVREASHLWLIGKRTEAVGHMRRAFASQPGSGLLAKQLIEYAFELKDLELVKQIIDQFEKQPEKIDETLPYFSMAKALIDRDMNVEAGKVLDRLPPLQKLNIDEMIEAAILKRKAKDFQKAHSFFEEVYSLAPNDPQVIYEFARTKIKLAKNTPGEKNGQMKKRLNQEAVELLRKAIGLTGDSTKKAWCWLELARSLDWLGAPNNETREAFLKARPQLSNEPSFINAYERWQSKTAASGTSTGLWNKLKSFFTGIIKK
jgi:ATP-dependent DNA helicase RecG